MPPELIAVAFDAVGTLIDPKPSVSEAYRQAALRQGVALDRRLLAQRFSEHFRRDDVDDRHGPMTTDEANERRRWRRIVEGVLSEVPDRDRAFEELWEHFSRPEAWRCFEDVEPALDDLKARDLKVIIASNFDARLRTVLKGIPALASLTDSVVISSEVGYRKPHAAFFRELTRRLGTEPRRILLVGDDPVNDVEGGRAAGLRTLLLHRKSEYAALEAPDRPLWLTERLRSAFSGMGLLV